jgi:hypothetical protein
MICCLPFVCLGPRLGPSSIVSVLVEPDIGSTVENVELRRTAAQPFVPMFTVTSQRRNLIVFPLRFFAGKDERRGHFS